MEKNDDLSISFYKNKKPNKDEIVLIIFIEERDSHFNGKLVEYSCDAFLRKEDATKKTKHIIWDKIVPIGKELIGRVDEVNSDNSVQVSLTYMDNDDKTIIENFNKNKKLISLVKSMGIQNSIFVNTIWESIIYIIDERRREEYEIADMPPLLQYCVDELDILTEFFNEDKIFLKFKEALMKSIEEKAYKIKSIIGIISYNGVQNTIELLNKATKNIKYKYSLNYTYYKKNMKSFPSYLFETFSEDSNDSDHENLISFLEKEAKSSNNNLLVCVFEKCKKNI